MQLARLALSDEARWSALGMSFAAELFAFSLFRFFRVVAGTLRPLSKGDLVSRWSRRVPRRCRCSCKCKCKCRRRWRRVRLVCLDADEPFPPRRGTAYGTVTKAGDARPAKAADQGENSHSTVESGRRVEVTRLGPSAVASGRADSRVEMGEIEIGWWCVVNGVQYETVLDCTVLSRLYIVAGIREEGRDRPWN